MTPAAEDAALAPRLARLIRGQGPLTLSQFMAEAVGHYYATRQPFGEAGDFVTAPEISQMFGELIGLWAAQCWLQMGRPARLGLIEIGPGRGTLMQDALRAARAVPAFLQAAQVHLVEASPRLRQVQAERLAGSGAAWHGRLADVPELPLVVIANELFDALPIRQFVRSGRGWHERMVDIAENGGFRFALTPDPVRVEALLAPAVAAAAPGSLAEISPAGRALAGEIAARLAEAGGAALIIDYGTPASAPGDSLQALRRHRPQDVLQHPGEADLTAHVDFAALAEAARAAGARTHGPLPQGEFLHRLGIAERAKALRRGAGPARAAAVDAALHRLTAAAAMGTLFQVLALSHPDLPIPAGFESSP